MSSIITSLFHVTLGALWENLRDRSAEKLKDGDFTDEKCRQLLVRELDDIKSRLDGLARKDLLSSISFLKEGVRLLDLPFDEFTDGQPAFTTEKKGDTSQAEELTMPEVDDSNPKRSSAYNEALALSQAIIRFSIVSEERYSSAKSSFKAAREKATEAFSNETLGTEDRILATKLRVISRILESLEDPPAAAVACKLYLEELHDMDSIRKMYSVYFKGGMRSIFNKTKRLKTIKSVVLINYVVLDFIVTFAKKAVDLFTWPRIKIGKRRSLHTIMDQEIVKIMKISGEHAPNQVAFNKPDAVVQRSAEFATVNSKGEIIVKKYPSGSVVVVSSKGETLFPLSPAKEDTGANYFKVTALATDDVDNVYVVTRYRTPFDETYNKLFVFDAKGNIIRKFALAFLDASGSNKIAVNKDEDIFISTANEGRVYVCDNRGRLKWNFSVQGRNLITCLTISDKNEVITALAEKSFYIYSEKGEFKRKFDLRGGHELRGRGVAFDHVTKKIIVLTAVRHDGDWRDYQLESYSESGELLQNLSLPQQMRSPVLTSHPNGPVALVSDTGVLFI